MWYERLGEDGSWARLWYGYVRCSCGGITTVQVSCPACGARPYPLEPQTVLLDGREVELPVVFAGAEARYEDWVYLIMLQREWMRPVTEAESFQDIPEADRPAQKSALVLLFWTYFETRIDRLFREALAPLPPRIRDDLLRRHSQVGVRLDRLYRTVFSSTYSADLTALGFGDVSELLAELRERRNAFVHGHPEAIDDNLVRRLVECIAREHESWIAVFNRRLHSLGQDPAA